MSPYFGGPTESVADTPHYRPLESLAQSAKQWLTLKKSLTHQEGVKALKTLTERNQDLAATLRSNLSAGTLRFRNQMTTEQIRPSLPKRKQATPAKKGQKRPIISSSPSSSEDNRPLKPTSSRQRISAKTVAVPARPQLPSLVSSSTPSRAQIFSSKSKHNLVSEAPGVQAIPYPQHSTPVVDLTASSSTSGNQGAEVPISIKPKSPSPTKDKFLLCPDLIPISSDDESSVPKLQECTSSKLVASGLPTRDVSGLISEPDGNISSSSNSSRISSRRKKQTTFYGSPIRHSVNVVQASLSSSPSTSVSPRATCSSGAVPGYSTQCV